MALVDYGSGSDSDLSEDEQDPESPKVQSQVPKVDPEPEPSKPSANVLDSGDISDEDESHWGQADLEEEDDLNLPGLSTSQSIFAALPQASKITPSVAAPDEGDYLDANEDLSTIPEAKTYGNSAQNLPKPPAPKNRKGPVKIFAPSIADLGDDSDEEGPPKKRFVPSFDAPRKSTGLLSLIPAPKMSTVGSNIGKKPEATASTSTSTKPNALIPRSIARPPLPTLKKPIKPKTAAKAQDSSDDEDGTFSYFTLEKEEIIPTSAEEESFKSKIASVNSIPSTSARNPQTYELPSDEDVYGPAIAPYPPPAPSTSQVEDDDGLLADQIAMERLLGKNALKKKQLDGINFIEVKNDDIKPDPREWMVKALSESSERGEPGPKNMIKGEKKRKHQITYLAAMAKEKEHVLKQQWSQNAQTRRATQSKYGF